MDNYLDNLFTKYSAIKAIDLYEKIAAVEALEHFSRSEPNDMDEEELRGWRSAKSRVLSVSSSTDNPSEAEEKLQEIIDGSPNPQNSRDRGRLRGLNEALDALTKNTSDMGEVEKAPNGSDTDMENRDYFNQNAHPNPGTPGAGGYEHDWGVGTGPMPRTSKTSAVPKWMPSLDEIPSLDDSTLDYYLFNIQDGMDKGYMNRGSNRYSPETLDAIYEIFNALVDEANNRGQNNNQTEPSSKFIYQKGDLVTLRPEYGGKGNPAQVVMNVSSNKSESDRITIDVGYGAGMSSQTQIPLYKLQPYENTINSSKTSNIPPVNRSGLYDLMKFVELGGDNIEWEEFKNSSAVNNKELDSLLEVLTETGAASSMDGSLDSGSFRIDEDKLLDLVTQREEE